MWEDYETYGQIDEMDWNEWQEGNKHSYSGVHEGPYDYETYYEEYEEPNMTEVYTCVASDCDTAEDEKECEIYLKLAEGTSPGEPAARE